MVLADMAKQQLAVRTGVLAQLAWKRLTGVVPTCVEVQTLLLNTAVRAVLAVVGFLLGVCARVPA